MVREFTEKEKNIEPGQPAFSLYDSSLNAPGKEKTRTVKADGPQLRQLDAHHVQVRLPNNDRWQFELDKPITLKSGEWTTDFLNCGLKSFTDPTGITWQNKGNEWMANTHSGRRQWQGSVRNSDSNSAPTSETTSIYFQGNDGLNIEITDKGSQDVDFDCRSPKFKKDILELLHKYDRNHNGAWDKKELRAALNSATGIAAVELAALDENFSDIASLDQESSRQPTKISQKALDKFDAISQTLKDDTPQDTLDTADKIAGRVADSLKNGYLDLIGSPDKTIKELRQEVRKEMSWLHRQYKIDIAAPGERPYLDKSFRLEKSDDIYLAGSRTPRLYELRLFEAAVNQTNPYYINKDGSQGVKLYFLIDPDLGKNSAEWNVEDKDRRPCINIYPNRISQSMNNLKRVYMHELAHNGQYNMGWDNNSVFTCDELTEQTNKHNLDFLSPNDQKRTYLHVLPEEILSFRQSDDKIPSPDGEYGKQMASAMGWQLDNDGNVIGLRGIDGQLYKPIKAGAGVDWQSVNQKFPFLKITLTSDQMEKIALFGSPGNYFCNPKEQHAEIMMKYLDHGESELSPQLINIAKKDDQAGINRVYGIAENRQPKRIRNDDGILIDNPACDQTKTCNSDTTASK